jgi:hypothetical protein
MLNILSMLNIYFNIMVKHYKKKLAIKDSKLLSYWNGFLILTLESKLKMSLVKARDSTPPSFYQ